MQVRWRNDEGRVFSGSQHFSSKFSSKNIEVLVLGANEYINHVSGRSSQSIMQLTLRTNFGRTKKFGFSDNGDPFDLKLPSNAEVVGFKGSYASQLFSIGALYRPSMKPSPRPLVGAVEDRILAFRRLSIEVDDSMDEWIFEKTKDNFLLGLMRGKSSQSHGGTLPGDVRNVFIMKTLMILVKSASKNDKNVIPSILNVLATLLEDGEMDVLSSAASRNDDPYEDLMNFMRSIVLDCPSPDNSSLSSNDTPYRNQCIRVMIAASIARGSLGDMLAIVKLILQFRHSQKYSLGKILFKLHEYSSSLLQLHNPQFDDSNPFCPFKAIQTYAPMLNNLNGPREDLPPFDGLSLVIILLSELLIVAKSRRADPTWTLNKSTIPEALHVDLSPLVFSLLSDILSISQELDELLLSHSLELLLFQLKCVEMLCIRMEDLEFPPSLVSKLKEQLFSIARHPNQKQVSERIRRLACKGLIAGHKIFFENSHRKLLYLVGLILRSLGGHGNGGKDMMKRVEKYCDEFVLPLSSISKEEMDEILPYLFSNISKMENASQLFDSVFIPSSEMEDASENRQILLESLEVLSSICIDETTTPSSNAKRKACKLMKTLHCTFMVRYSNFIKSESKSINWENETPPLLTSFWERKDDISYFQSKSERIHTSLLQYVKNIIISSTSLLKSTTEVGPYFLCIVSPILTCLLGFVERSPLDSPKEIYLKAMMHHRISKYILPHLTVLLEATDSFKGKEEEKEKEKGEELDNKKRILVKETNHPYRREAGMQEFVSIPGAKSLKMTFDPNCCTDSHEDFLQCFVKIGDSYTRVGRPMSGKNDEWPDSLLIPGDSVLLHFSTSALSALKTSSGNRDEETSRLFAASFGWRVTIEGEIMVPSSPKPRWLEDFNALLVKFHGVVASNFIDFGSLRFDFGGLRKYSFLFSSGLVSVESTGKCLIPLCKMGTPSSDGEIRRKAAEWVPSLDLWMDTSVEGKEEKECNALLWNLRDNKCEKGSFLETVRSHLLVGLAARMSSPNLEEKVDSFHMSMDACILPVFISLLKHTGVSKLLLTYVQNVQESQSGEMQGYSHAILPRPLPLPMNK